MSHAHSSTPDFSTEPENTLSNHVENTVTQYKQLNAAVQIRRADASESTGSQFSASQHHQTFHIDPYEHPVLTVLLEQLFENRFTQQGVSIERKSPDESYEITIHCLDENHEPLSHYSTPTEGIVRTDEPGDNTFTHTTNSLSLSLSDPCCETNPRTDTISCEQITTIESGLDRQTAIVFTVLDAFKLARTGRKDLFCTPEFDPDYVNGHTQSQETVEEVKEHRNKFLVGMPHALRIKWILDGISEPFPIERVSEAVDVPELEIPVQATILDAAGIKDTMLVNNEIYWESTVPFNLWCEQTEGTETISKESNFVEENPPINAFECVFEQLTDVDLPVSRTSRTL